MKTLKPTVIELLMLLRKRKHWTQSQCAKRLGVTVRTLRSWECIERTSGAAVRLHALVL
ncbi:MAG: helix-turn-helix domain-containing protein [Verrucomicrobia bacterium]|nr:helix-turn-helix domain-containing protein [Verrucomicrobiota bacterium]